ncbi:ankyrin [Wilcoxina mikolae CBS 423.85]|nr:ankyrin [Wilcoxina mikolae CBS 423.85]
MLADICAGLVIIEEGSNIVRLAHYTTQEYLIKKSVVPPEHLRGGYHATVCVTQLSFDEFKSGVYTSFHAFEERLRCNPFLHYAAQNLSIHLKAGGDESSTVDDVATFVQDSNCVSSYLQAKDASVYQCHDYPRGYHAIHVASELGHGTVTWRLIDLDDATVLYVSVDHRTPLHIAVEYGHEPVARLLIDRGSDVSAVDKDGSTPLHFTALLEHEVMVRLLIEMRLNTATHRLTAERSGSPATPRERG